MRSNNSRPRSETFMNRNERTLRALRSQAQFAVVQQAAAVAHAAEMTAHTDERVAALEDRVESYLHQLQRTMVRPQLNAALLAAMRRGQRLEQSELGEWRWRRVAAQRHEQQARATLAEVRNHERSLERALVAERRKCESSWQAVEMIRADEMWLQRSASGET
jgi:hypothetical protein